MSKILEELKDIVINSNLPGTDQNDLLIFLPVLPERVLEDLVDVFKKSPRMVKVFNEDFKAKLEALIDGRDAYQKMIEKEGETLQVLQEEFSHQEGLEEGEIAEKNENLPPKDEEEAYLDNDN
jgi:N-methylhydantoinase B/oxoprolinase/acetone carboxylase alpha subunit